MYKLKSSSWNTLFCYYWKTRAPRCHLPVPLEPNKLTKNTYVYFGIILHRKPPIMQALLYSWLFCQLRQFSHSLHSQRRNKISLYKNLQNLKIHWNQINNCKYWDVEQFLYCTTTQSNPKTFSFCFKDLPVFTFLTFATFSHRKFWKIILS